MILKNKTIANAILRKMARECGFDIDNVYLSEYGYVCTVDINKPDADFCKTDYKGVMYRVEYLEGCFNPFITITQ